jgi:hypothetical protein
VEQYPAAILICKVAADGGCKLSAPSVYSPELFSIDYLMFARYGRHSADVDLNRLAPSSLSQRHYADLTQTITGL